MYVRETVRTYPENKTSSNVRALEDVKNEMKMWKKAVDVWNERIEEYESGWDDDSGDSAKRDRLTQGLQKAKDNYAKLKTEYESHPGYYADKYKDAGGVAKATTGILGSAIATVPVIWNISKNELDAHRRYHEDHPTQVNYFDIDPASFGAVESKQQYFDVDPEKAKPEPMMPGLDNYRKPVDRDSWGMKLMEEALWLEEDAEKTILGSFANNDAEVLGNLGPLKFVNGAVKTAEEMYRQVAQGETTGEAMRIGALTAAGQILENVIPVKQIVKSIDSGEFGIITDILHAIGVPVGEGTLSCTADFLLDKIKSGESEFTFGELLQSIFNSWGSIVIGEK